MTTVRFELPPFDIDNDGSAETLVFEFSDNLVLTHRIRTGWLTEGNGSTAIDILTDLIEDATGTEIESSGRRQGLYTDLGGGARTVETRGEVVTDNDTHQWGTGDGGTWDATGDSALAKIQLLDQALTLAEIDSRPADGNYPQGHLATLEAGEFSSSGRFDALSVVPEQPEGTFDTTRSSSTATLDLNFVAAASLEIAVDAAQQSDA